MFRTITHPRNLFGVLVLIGSGCATDLSEPTSLPPDAGVGFNIPEPEPEIQTIVVDPVEATTRYLSTPVSGRGPSNGRLLLSISDGRNETYPISPNGYFCVDIDLNPSSDHTFTFTAQNAEGVLLDVSVKRSIRQEGVPPEPEQPLPALVDLGTGATDFRATVNIAEGDESLMFDENESTHVVLSNSWVWRDYFSVDLPVQGNIQSIVIKTPDDCPITRATVFYSNTESEEKLMFYDPWAVIERAEQIYPEWEIFREINNASRDSELQLYTPIPGGTVAKRIAIEFVDHSCGPQHKISDFKIMVGAPEDDETPSVNPSSGPTCTNGGR